MVQPFQRENRPSTGDILTYKDGPRTKRNKTCLMVVDQ